MPNQMQCNEIGCFLGNFKIKPASGVVDFGSI